MPTSTIGKNKMNSEINIQDIGNHVPRRGNSFSRKFAQWSMKLFGWSIQGELPNLSKFIIVGAPHTSNWDFILVIATAAALNVRISWMAKHSLFRGPMGPVFRWMGGIAVDRKAAGGVVGDSVNTFNKTEKLILCITPEGTRGKVTTWKSGFYRIAQNAEIPILLASFDYGKKVVGLGPVYRPSGDFDADLVEIKKHYEDVQAKHPKSV